MDVASKVYNLTVIKRQLMKRKHLAFLLILGVCITKTAFPQDITGTWEGYYGIGQYYDGARGMHYHLGKDSVFLHMELHQEGRKIVGLFYYSSDPHNDNPIVMYKVSGLLDKKEPTVLFQADHGWRDGR